MTTNMGNGFHMAAADDVFGGGYFFFFLLSFPTAYLGCDLGLTRVST